MATRLVLLTLATCLGAVGCPAEFTTVDPNDGAPTLDAVAADVDDSGGTADTATGGDTADALVSDVAPEAPPGCGTGCQNCKEVRTLTGVTADKQYPLDVDGVGPKPPFSVYCHGMATSAPIEFLTVDPAKNFSTFKGCDCGGITVRYDKIRFDLPTMTLDVKDQTFAKPPEGDLACRSCFGSASLMLPTVGGMKVLPLVTAAGCRGATSGTGSGEGHLDLRGTPFRGVGGTVGSFLSSGGGTASAPSPDGKEVHVSVSVNATFYGPGGCGYYHPPAPEFRVGVQFE